MTSLIDSLPVEIQPRDIALLRGLFESRIMTLAHAAALYFNGKPEAAKKRTQKLKAAGLVRERSRRVYEPSILYLTQKAFNMLSHGSHISDYPRLTWEKLERRVQVSDLTIRHELAVMNVKAAFCAALQDRPTFNVTEFSTWPKLSEFNAFHPATGAKLTVKPDGFIRVREKESDGGNSEHIFFLEVDRSTEVLERLTDKVLCYLNYYKHGGLAVRFGQHRDAFRDFPFRVLIVCKSTERRDNIAMRLLKTNPPIRTFVWLTTIKEITMDPLGAIWVQSADFDLMTSAAPAFKTNSEHGRSQPHKSIDQRRRVLL
jgi:hypothetical protein